MGCACGAKNIDGVAPRRFPHQVYCVDAPRLDACQSCHLGEAASGPSSSIHEHVGVKPNSHKIGHVLVDAGGACGVRTHVGEGLEDTILEEGCQIQGLIIRQWNDADDDIANNFYLAAGASSKAFEDPDGRMDLTRRQRELLDAWRRLPDVVRVQKGPNAQPEVVSKSVAARSIRQGLVGDCSFLCALAALAEYEAKFQTKVLTSIIHPKTGAANHAPAYSEWGMYACKLFLNGTERKVVVDDVVPTRADGSMTCGHSSVNNELWVTLLEKSFAKIMGRSYDMQGSNPGTDVFHLARWIPETVPLGAVGHSDLDEIYTAAERGFVEGHCVICLGTSGLFDAVQDDEVKRLGHLEGVSVSTGLVAHHAYSVLDCKRFGNDRLLFLKNPWGRVRWRGRYAPGDKAWKGVSKAAARGDLSAELLALQGCVARSVDDDGYFWIEWQDVKRYFSHLYLCWSPKALGLRCVEVHGRWDPRPHFISCYLPDDTHVVAFNPQFLLRFDSTLAASGGGQEDVYSAWVLLSRHVHIRHEIASKYIAAHIYTGSQRVCCPDAPLEQGIYSNGECALVRLAAKQGEGCKEFVIVVSQHAQKSIFNFTLQVFTAKLATVTPLPHLLPETWHSGATSCEWTKDTAGGCSNNLWQYFTNPHWRIDIPDGEPVSLVLFLECPTEYSVNIRLFRNASARPEHLHRAISSGPYRQGCCVLRQADIQPGPYVVVVSTFKPGLCCGYRLAWHCSRLLRLRPQPQTFAETSPSPLGWKKLRLSPVANSRLYLHALNMDMAQELPPETFPATTLVSAKIRFEQGAKQVSRVCRPPALRLLSQPKFGVGSSEDEFEESEDSLGAFQCDSYAELYFRSTQAVVLLIAELAPGDSKVLEVLHRDESEADSSSTCLLEMTVAHDGPLHISAVEQFDSMIAATICFSDHV